MIQRLQPMVSHQNDPTEKAWAKMATEGLFFKKEQTNLPTKNGGYGTVDSNSNPLKYHLNNNSPWSKLVTYTSCMDTAYGYGKTRAPPKIALPSGKLYIAGWNITIYFQ